MLSSREVGISHSFLRGCFIFNGDISSSNFIASKGRIRCAWMEVIVAKSWYFLGKTSLTHES
jgi:hypothetical protein